MCWGDSQQGVPGPDDMLRLLFYTIASIFSLSSMTSGSFSLLFCVFFQKTIQLNNTFVAYYNYYNIDYLNPKEKECLETTLLLYGLQITNTEQPTRVKGSSQSLIDFIINDLPKSKCFETIVSDTPLRTLKNGEKHHWATSKITSIQMKKKSKVTIKEV